MRLIRIALLLVILLTVGGCASVHYQDLDKLPTAQPDQALIYFYRESKFAGSAVSYYIYEGEEKNKIKHGALKNGTFFFINVKPGKHTYWAKTEAKDVVTLNVQAGKTYYVKGEVDMGFFAGHPDLTVAHEMEGKSEISELKYAIVKKSS